MKPNYYLVDISDNESAQIFAAFETPKSETGRYILTSLYVNLGENSENYYFRRATNELFPFGGDLDDSNAEAFAFPNKYSAGSLSFDSNKPYKFPTIIEACEKFFAEHNIEVRFDSL